MISLTVRLEQYLTVRRNLGYDLSFTERVLRRFTALADSEGAEHITVDLFLRWKTVFKLSRGCRITYRPKVISTPLALRLKLTPWCVDTIWISTPLSFFIAVALAPPPTAAPAETAV